MPFFVFSVVRTFRAIHVVRKGQWEVYLTKKIRKSIDSQDQIRLCFHEKEVKI